MSSEFFEFLFGSILGAVAVYGPTLLFLRNDKRWEGREFAKAYSDKKWVRWVYPASRICWMLGLLSVFLVWIIPNSDRFDVLFFACVMWAGIGFLNALFEILAGISPVVYFKGKSPQYIYSRRAQKVGLVRVILGLLVVFVSYRVGR